MQVVGYTIGQDQYHKECVSGLIDENRDTVMIVNGETIEVTPMFDIQDEYDCYPTCEECKQHIEDVQLTSDGIDWLNEQGKKTDWQSWGDVVGSDANEFFIAYGNGDNWYCLDCFISYVLEDKSELIKMFLANIKSDNITDNEYITDVFTSNEIEFTSFPNDFMVNGVYCHECGSELYAPLEESET